MVAFQHIQSSCDFGLKPRIRPSYEGLIFFGLFLGEICPEYGYFIMFFVDFTILLCYNLSCKEPYVWTKKGEDRCQELQNRGFDIASLYQSRMQVFMNGFGIN